jgi:hypothetical protein
VLIDELHAHKTPDLYGVLETAIGARRMWFFHFFGEPQNKQFESAGVRFDASSQTLLKSKTFASLIIK